MTRGVNKGSESTRTRMGPRNISCRERSSAPSHCPPDRHG